MLGSVPAKPVIDLRHIWKDEEETRLLNGRSKVTYNYKGNVYSLVQKQIAEGKWPMGDWKKIETP